MTQVLLSKIVPNPFRDLRLYPLDKTQVEKLVHSINRHGFFGGVTARENGRQFELACGHHRIEAARKAGLNKVDIIVRDISDDEMVRLMTSENAIQAGSKAAAIMNEVGAVVRRLAKPMLVSGHLGQICPRWPEIAECFQSQKAYEVACGTLETGDGIGWRLIRAYLGGAGDESLCPRDEHQIKDGLAAIKAAGIYATIIAEVRDDIERERIEAAREAEKAPTKAKEEQERALTEAAEAADKAVATSEKKNPRIFDEQCVRVFANDDQFRAFRQAVTSKNGQKFIPVDRQMALAKFLMDSIGAGVAGENKNNRGRISAAYIKSFVSDQIAKAINAQKSIDREEKARLLEEQQEEVFLTKLKELKWAVRSVTGIGVKLLSLTRQNPRWAQDRRLGALEVYLEEAVQVLTTIHKGMNHGKADHRQQPRQIIASREEAKA